uniref:Uncharacterized protein n=1 Tax=Oryzias sinensis TaxID=183150 RepID=A0A8C7YCK5_9TELE
MELPYLDELSHGLANLSMFPYFDMAHYIVSVMALREQPGMFLISDAFTSRERKKGKKVSAYR